MPNPPYAFLTLDLLRTQQHRPVTSKPVHHPHMPLLSHQALMAQSGFSSCCAHLCYSLPVMTHATGGQRRQTLTVTMLLKQTESGAPFWNLLFLQSHGRYRKWYARKIPPSCLRFELFSRIGNLFRHFSASSHKSVTTNNDQTTFVECWRRGLVIFSFVFVFFNYCQKIPWNDWKQQHPCANVGSNHWNSLC